MLIWSQNAKLLGWGDSNLGEIMALVKNLEKRIWDIEGFGVVIKHADGRDMRGDKAGIPQYRFERMARRDMTVSAWREQRFRSAYIGYDVDVLDGTGHAVPGNTLLESVRKSYVED
jgi:hypothetical protein